MTYSCQVNGNHSPSLSSECPSSIAKYQRLRYIIIRIPLVTVKLRNVTRCAVWNRGAPKVIVVVGSQWIVQRICRLLNPSSNFRWWVILEICSQIQANNFYSNINLTEYILDSILLKSFSIFIEINHLMRSIMECICCDVCIAGFFYRVKCIVVPIILIRMERLMIISNTMSYLSVNKF